MPLSMTRRDLLWCGSVLGTSFLIGRGAFGQSVEPRISTHIYKTVGDLAIKADVYHHEDEVTKPAVVWIHGGALIGGSRLDIDRRVKQHVLDAGYVLISLDYRLAPRRNFPRSSRILRTRLPGFGAMDRSSSKSTPLGSRWPAVPREAISH